MTVLFVAVSVLVFGGTVVATFLFCTWLATPEEDEQSNDSNCDSTTGD